MSAWSAAGRASTPSPPGRRARSTCATSTPADRDDMMARIGAIIDRTFVPGTTDGTHHQGRVPAADADPGGEAPVRDLCHRRRRHRLHNRRRIHRRLRRFRLHRGVGRADDLRGRPGRRQGAQPGRVFAHRQPGAARAGLRARYAAAGAGGTVAGSPRRCGGLVHPAGYLDAFGLVPSAKPMPPFGPFEWSRRFRRDVLRPPLSAPWRGGKRSSCWP